MGSGLAQPNILNKPVNPRNTRKLKHVLWPSASSTAAARKRQPRARSCGWGCRPPLQLGRQNLRAPPPRGQGRRALQPSRGRCPLRDPPLRVRDLQAPPPRGRGRQALQPSCGRCHLRDPPLSGPVPLSAAVAVRAESTSSIAVRPGAVKLLRFSLEPDVQELGGDEIGSEKKITCGGAKKEVSDSSAMVARAWSIM
ncbi:hypothetical protein PVAP13_2KG557530 [Panicum virgatum]|uniref:Uncharacterized protein n=1 Tax=Panicum virgatum TaxID=38727 RepID=A0A8T0WB67_PANVG|nr:hypothetical protein PVAP13_2KG557530 [Panicum virgatum]